MSLFRQLTALEEDNANLLRNLNAKEEALRNAQVGQTFLIQIISKRRTTLIIIINIMIESIKIARLNEFFFSFIPAAMLKHMYYQQ